MISSRRLTAGIASVFLAGLPMLAPPAATASPIGACTETVGTIVAVDFGHWGGPIIRGCGIDEPSGFALLHAAGFTTSFDQHDGPASVCRIGSPDFDSGTQHPSAAEDRCIVTSPTTAYWSYWLAAKGHNRWTYSQYGATQDRPKPGEVQIWEFGATNVSGTVGAPTVSPQSLRATNPKPTSARPRSSVHPTPSCAHPTPSSAHPTPSSAPPTPPSAQSAPQPSATRSRRAAARRSSPHPSRLHARNPARATPIRSTSAPRIVNAVPTAARRSSHGSATGVLVGVVLALLLGGGAGWVGWRRRRLRP